MITVQCVILFTKISRIGNKVVCLYSGKFRLNYVFILVAKRSSYLFNIIIVLFASPAIGFEFCS